MMKGIKKIQLYPEEPICGRTVQENGDPVANAQVRLVGTTGTRKGETRSAADGTFSFPAVGAGLYEIHVSAAGFPAYQKTVSHPGGPEEVVVTFYAEATIDLEAISPFPDVVTSIQGKEVLKGVGSITHKLAPGGVFISAAIGDAVCFKKTINLESGSHVKEVVDLSNICLVTFAINPALHGSQGRNYFIIRKGEERIREEYIYPNKPVPLRHGDNHYVVCDNHAQTSQTSAFISPGGHYGLRKIAIAGHVFSVPEKKLHTHQLDYPVSDVTFVWPADARRCTLEFTNADGNVFNIDRPTGHDFSTIEDFPAGTYQLQIATESCTTRKSVTIQGDSSYLDLNCGTHPPGSDQPDQQQ